MKAPNQRHTRRNPVKLSIAIPGNEPPDAFRIFTTPTVETVKGSFAFGPDEAASVMAEYELHGIDLAVDYDHASLAADTALDPALAGKAAGWFGLELRDGELWAVNVRWNPAADAALRAKEFRFMSPAFTTKGNRITSVLNVALTNLPATRRLEPLMAASAAGDDTMPTLNDAITALENGDAATALAILKELAAAPAEKPEKAPTPPAESVEAASLMKLTGCTSLAGVAAEYKTLARERQELTAEKAEYESAERVRLCRSLVVDAGHAPAQVWDQTAYTLGETPVPKAIFAKLTLAELKEHVKQEVAVLGKRPGRVALGRAIMPPPGDDGLTDRQRAVCKEMNLDPKAYAEALAVSR